MIQSFAHFIHAVNTPTINEGAVKAAVEEWYESLPKAAVQEIHKYRKYASRGTAGKPVLDEIVDILKSHGVKPGFFGTLKKAAQHIKSGGYQDFMVPMFDLKEESSPAWQRKEGKDPEGGLNKAGVAAYRRENPGSKLQTAVTTKPSKLKPGSKSAKRRKSFCSRMKGMKAKLTSAATARDPDSRINKSLRKWNCS
jgi:hypothetical protein